MIPYGLHSHEISLHEKKKKGSGAPAQLIEHGFLYLDM